MPNLIKFEALTSSQLLLMSELSIYCSCIIKESTKCTSCSKYLFFKSKIVIKIVRFIRHFAHHILSVAIPERVEFLRLMSKQYVNHSMGFCALYIKLSVFYFQIKCSSNFAQWTICSLEKLNVIIIIIQRINCLVFENVPLSFI